MKPLVLALALSLSAVELLEASPGSLRAPSTFDAREGFNPTGPRSQLDAVDPPSRRLITGGTPTGGNKYPFLVLLSVKRWNEEPLNMNVCPPRAAWNGACSAWYFSHYSAFFNQEPNCHGVMLTKDVSLYLRCEYEDFETPISTSPSRK
jgi:hypothetical protein